MTTSKPPIDRFPIDHGETGEPPPRQQMNAWQMGTAYVYVGATGELIPIPREGDPDFDEKMEKVAAALRPKREVK
jgi:hypothetical protein